jgi:NAD(P)-dependent dehydrogenase (short-subunit alcohol dehydrogenase family)
MKRVVLVTGSASGIGRATVTRLEAQGHRVIGVDLRDADIEANLADEAGRRRMIEEVARLAPDGLDGVLAGAGISNPERAADTVSINYFGAVATLTGLRPMLARSAAPRAVAICSTAALLPVDETAMAACLAGDEASARATMAGSPQLAYMTSKRALSLWLRRAAVDAAWGGAGVLLNGVAPGIVETPMSAPLFRDPAMVALMAQSNPMAVEGYAQPEEIAELISYLLTFEGHYLLGQVIFIDGGTDAIMRPQSF